MKSFLYISLIIISFVPPSFGGSTPEDDKTQESLRNNVIDFRDWLMKQLSQFPKADPSNAKARSYAYIPRQRGIITNNQFDQAAKSDWVKREVMRSLSDLSRELAKTAGTVFAPQSAGQLQRYSNQLLQSKDPQFQQIGTLYSQEAQALQTGNTQAAKQAANQVTALPQPYVPPGYKPTQNESNLAGTINQVIGMLINAVLTAVVAYYGGPVAASIYSQTLGTVFTSGQNPGGANSRSQNPGTAMNNVGTNAVQTGGGALMQQLGNINVSPRQSQDSANTGGAPSAQ